MPHSPNRKSLNKKTVSLRQIAEVAGVSRMTVSRAFKKETSIKPELRNKILKIAQDLGYIPDTMVSELMTSFASRRPINYQETFAAIWWPESWENTKINYGFDTDIYLGLNEGAKLHGRSIDHFVLTKDMPPRVITRMLNARNIQGVILTPPDSAEMEAPKLNWETLSAVTIGSSLRKPKFHRVQPSHYNAMVQALEVLEKRGYKRPCLLVRNDEEQRMRRAYTAAFLAWGFPRKHIWHADSARSEGLSTWFQKTKPDVIIADRDCWFNCIPQSNKACGFISLAVRRRYGAISGIHQNTKSIAKGAIDLLVGARLTHELGESTAPLLLLTAGTWIEGQSLSSDKQ